MVFKTILKAILESFEFEWRKEFPLYDKDWGKPYYIMTPIGIPAVLEWKLTLRAFLDIFLKI